MMTHVKRQLRRILGVPANVRKDEGGAALVEYALISAVVGIGSLLATTNLATQLSNAMNYTSCKVSLSNPAAGTGGTGGSCTWGGGGTAS